MSRLTLIAAVSRNGVIGKDNALPWHLPEDLKHFKQLTTGHAVIMGRKTWESLPARFRPLPNRSNIVISRNAAFDAPGAQLAGTLEAALAAAGSQQAFVIGGAQLYGLAMPVAQRLEITEIGADFAGDAWFPPIDPALWVEAARLPGRSADGLDYAFVTFLRR